MATIEEPPPPPKIITRLAPTMAEAARFSCSSLIWSTSVSSERWMRDTISVTASLVRVTAIRGCR